MSKRKNINHLPHPQPGQQVQIKFDPSDLSPKVCEQCSHALFDIAYRIGVISALSPKNPTGKEIPVKTEVLICRACGWELGGKIEPKQ